MAVTSTNMGLRIWNLLDDLYDHDQIADNWDKVDLHDHSPDKGVQIPTEGLEDGAVTPEKLAEIVDPSGAYLSYKTVHTGITVVGVGVAAGTWALQQHDATRIPAINANASTSVIHIDPADFAVSGRPTKFRIKSTLVVQDSVAPGVNFTVALQPVTAAVDPDALTVGAALSGSSVVFTTPGSLSLNVATSSDFDISTAGYYLLTLVTSGTTGASTTHIRAELAVHNI